MRRDDAEDGETLVTVGCVLTMSSASVTATTGKRESTEERMGS